MSNLMTAIATVLITEAIRPGFWESGLHVYVVLAVGIALDIVPGIARRRRAQ